jgi:RNA polymerase sigma-70 factor, ECF subfamily
MPDPDHNLVQCCLRGDAQAFGTLYDRHAVRVHRLLTRLTGNATLAEDLTQETFVIAHRSLMAWRGDGAFASWLDGIGVRLYRKSLRHPHWLEADLPEDADQVGQNGQIGTEIGDPFAVLSRKQSAERLESAIGALPEAYREVFVLLWVEGMKQREVAALLELPIGTVQSRLWRAVCLLRKGLQEPNAVEHPVSGNLAGEEKICNALHNRA